MGLLMRNLLALGLLVGVVGATPAFAQDTEARLRVFAKVVGKAADELDVPRPTVTVVSLEEAYSHGAGPLVAAYVRQSTDGKWHVFVVWAQLMGASDRRLQCWARHEVTHVLMDHRFAKDAHEAAVHHDAVRHFMEARWRQDSACLID